MINLPCLGAQRTDAVEKLFFNCDSALNGDQKRLPCGPLSLITRLIAMLFRADSHARNKQSFSTASTLYETA